MQTLIHISDTHILPREDDRLQGVDTLRTLEQDFDYVISSGLRADALVVSGDLANHGELDSYRRLRPMLEQVASALGAQLVVCMGNHDSRSAFREGMLDQPPSEAPIEYVRWIDGLRMIVLDSTVPGAPYGETRAEQLDWLRTELRSPAPDGTLVVLHHPPVPDKTPLAGLLTLHGSADLEEVVRGSDVMAVLAGHAHHAIASTFGGVLCYAAPATAYSVDPLVLGQRTLRGVEGSGFGLIRVIDRRVVALTIAMPSEGRQTYRHDLDDRVLNRLVGESVVAA
jgi:3',5'-cyclic AMP phosphodiesterase CpdA